MKNQEKLKTFSVKKLLLTILFTVILSVFIGTTILFINAIPTWMETEVILHVDENSETLIEIMQNFEQYLNNVEEAFKETKAQYGEDYPAEGLFFKITMNVSSQRIVQVYSMSLLIGLVLGTIIYIVAVQNIKGKQVVIELLVAFAILFILISLLNVGYDVLINKAIKEINPTQTTHYSTYIFDLDGNNILIPYIVVAVFIYIVNIVKQKILTNKLNKQLQSNK